MTKRNTMNDLHPLLEVIQLYELKPEDTTCLAGVPHDALVNAMNSFLFHHGPRFGITGWSDMVQGLRDGGVDAVWQYRGIEISGRLATQIDSSDDFDRVEGFRRSVMAQIAESRQYELSHLLLGLAADLSNASHREKARGMLADVARMTDSYVVAVSPEKVAGIWRWQEGLKVEPLEQMKEAGYSWLTATYDSLGNMNHNSWGKGTGGDWSHLKTRTVHVGQNIAFRVIGHSPTATPLEYRFSVQRSGRCFEIRQDWSTSDSWTWPISNADIGRSVCVMVAVRTPKQYYQFNDADDYNYASYDVLPKKAKSSA